MILKPYLVIPIFIPQPTWGGSYIPTLKGWGGKNEFLGVKIGQSFELSGSIFFDIKTVNSSDPCFQPIFAGQSPDPSQGVSIKELIDRDGAAILGSEVYAAHKTLPILIKLNQAAGNSFQLHIKPGQQHNRWKMKPESWYFLEAGHITCGVKRETAISEFKIVCEMIDSYMKGLSHAVLGGTLTLDDARKQAKVKIGELNPWKFVNMVDIAKNEVVDLSMGGIHHSWEDDNKPGSFGNIVYEIQLDVPDDSCTIRAFDQGKIKNDGTIRELHINDYFTFLDTDPILNTIDTLRKPAQDARLIHTPYYSMDKIGIDTSTRFSLTSSFHHIYVESGAIQILANDHSLLVSRGHSCFVPAGLSTYTLIPREKETRILKTYIDPLL